MVNRKRGLGKGISALISGGNGNVSSVLDVERVKTRLGSIDSAQESEPSSQPVGADFRELPIEYLQPGVYQPRRSIAPDALEELTLSIKAQGVMQPLVVRSVGHSKYEIIAGERRWRASQHAGLHHVPCIIRQVSDEAALALAIIENIQREDLSPLEQAVGLQRLKTEFDLTHQQIADAVGRSRASISNLLRLLNLHESVKQMLDVGDLEIGHAKCLLPLEPDTQVKLAKQIIDEGMSVRTTETFIRKFLETKDRPHIAKPELTHNPDIALLQDSLAQKMGASVQIHHNNSGKGRLVIKYTTIDELEGILSHIQ